MEKGMTLYRHELELMDRKTKAISKKSVVSSYKDEEKVIASVEVDMRRGGMVVLNSKRVEERKCSIDLQAAWDKAPAIKAATPAPAPAPAPSTR